MVCLWPGVGRELRFQVRFKGLLCSCPALGFWPSQHKPPKPISPPAKWVFTPKEMESPGPRLTRSEGSAERRLQGDLC